MTSPMPDAAATSPLPCAAAAELVARLVQNADIPSLGLAVGRVAQLAESSTSSFGDLANHILSDVHLTQRVLRLANSAAVRRFSAPVTTVSRAIARIGSEQVKLIALSALLLERMADREMVAYLAAELLQALYASALADQLAPRLEAEPEEAAICALFRSIGRLMVAVYETPCFDEIRRVASAKGISESAAAKEVTGTDLEWIGQQILLHWGIPDAIAKTVAPWVPRSTPPHTPVERLQLISAFACEVAAAVRQPEEQVREETLERALSGFGPGMHLDAAALGELMQSAGARTQQFTIALGLEELSAPSSPPAAAADWPEIALPPPESSAPEHPPKAAPDAKPARASMLLLAGIQDMTTGIAEGQDVGSVLNVALETLYRGLGYRCAVLCLREPATNTYRARLTFGDMPPERVRAFTFGATAGHDLFSSVLQRNVDVHIRDASEPKIQANLPEWHRTACPDARSFVLLPIVVKQKPLGFFYADRAAVDDAGLDEQELALVRMLKGQTVIALRGHAA